MSPRYWDIFVVWAGRPCIIRKLKESPLGVGLHLGRVGCPAVCSIFGLGRPFRDQRRVFSLIYLACTADLRTGTQRWPQKGAGAAGGRFF